MHSGKCIIFQTNFRGGEGETKFYSGCLQRQRGMESNVGPMLVNFAIEKCTGVKRSPPVQINFSSPRLNEMNEQYPRIRLTFRLFFNQGVRIFPFSKNDGKKERKVVNDFYIA